MPAIRGLRRYHRAEVDPRALRKRLEGFRKGALRLDLGGPYRWDLELERTSIRSPGYTVRHVTSRGIRTVAPAPEQSFRGRIRGRPGSEVRLSFQDGRVNGFVDGGDSGRVFLEPLDHFQPGAPEGAHAVYLERDALPEPGAACGLASRRPGGLPLPRRGNPAFPGSPLDGGLITAPVPLPERSAAGSSAEPCALVEVAVAVEYSMVLGLGSAAAAEKRINDIYNMVDGLYQDPRINVRVRISEVLIETEESHTWGETGEIVEYLESMTAWMTGPGAFEKPFDAGSLWYYDLGEGTVGLAWMGVVCTGNRANVIRYYSAMSRTMMINAAHELGHNFNAPHIEDPEGIMFPSITGSNDDWDSSTIAAIVQHKRNRPCLSACNIAPAAAFAVSGPSACAEVRTFTDLSAGEPTSWLWEFGDGSTSRERNPVHTYAAPGRYTARLSATNDFGAASASRSNIRVQPIPPPSVQGAEGCGPAAFALEARGTGTLRWYDTASGGVPVAAGPVFRTPVLAATRTWHVEDGEADMPVAKVGPSSTAIGPGANFTATGDRRLFFDLSRPATLVSALVRAGSAGPRTIEILDSGDRRVAARTVQVPAGESRIPLGFGLDAGSGYAIKLVGSGDSANLFRNTSGAAFPYFSPDSLVTILGTDATAPDSATQAGFYYFFYDWEVREQGCSSPRVPVTARISCTVDLADAASPLSAALLPVAPGRYRLEGAAPHAGVLEILIRSLDGSLRRRISRYVPAGPLSIPLDLEALPSNLLLADIRLGAFRVRRFLSGF